LTFRKTGLIGRLDTDKNGIKAGRYHHIQELRVIGQIDRGFRKKNKSFFIFSPFNQGGQQLCFQVLFVSDKIVVNEENIAAPACIINTIQFCDDLPWVFSCVPDARKEPSRYKIRS
jgi:hypothetical protein